MLDIKTDDLISAIDNTAKVVDDLKTAMTTNNMASDAQALKKEIVISADGVSADKEIKVRVIGEREVEYVGQTWKLAPLTYKIYEQKGELNGSGSYQGAAYWQYKGKRLKDLPDKVF